MQIQYRLGVVAIHSSQVQEIEFAVPAIVSTNLTPFWDTRIARAEGASELPHPRTPAHLRPEGSASASSTSSFASSSNGFFSSSSASRSAAPTPHASASSSVTSSSSSYSSSSSASSDAAAQDAARMAQYKAEMAKRMLSIESYDAAQAIEGESL